MAAAGRLVHPAGYNAMIKQRQPCRAEPAASCKQQCVVQASPRVVSLLVSCSMDASDAATSVSAAPYIHGKAAVSHALTCVMLWHAQRSPAPALQPDLQGS
jgi:hypothetical protein